jgi:replication factor C subunit 1
VFGCRYKEGCKIDSAALEAVIEGAHSDMRQILNNLQMWSRTSKTFTYDGIRKDVDATVKDIKENPFSFAGRFFTSHFHKLSMDDRINVYFNDYSMAPNFVQESCGHPRPPPIIPCAEYALFSPNVLGHVCAFL